MSSLIGGPNCGQVFAEEMDESKTFIIMRAPHNPKLLSCYYRDENGDYRFIRSKTEAQLLEETNE